MFDIKQEVVRALADSVQRGGRSLGNVPALLDRVIEENMWQHRIIDDREITLSEFDEFVSLPYPEGLGTTIETLKALCKHVPKIMDFLAKASRGQHGGAHTTNSDDSDYMIDARGNMVEASKHDNVMLDKKYQQGNSAEYAYNKLRDEAYDDKGAVKNPAVAKIHKRVIAGEITPHKGMVEAGFRVRKVAVNMEDVTSAANTIMRYMDHERLTELVQLLAEHLADSDAP